MKEATTIKSLFDGEERMKSNMRKHIINKLLEFGTWDTIQHKGKNENGLIRWGQIPEERKELLISMAHPSHLIDIECFESFNIFYSFISLYIVHI